MPIPARLLKRLEAFLAVKSRSQGGYAPVGEEDIQALGEILGGIIEAKYEKDPDGDVPVRFNLVDRTRFWNNSFFNIPYTREGDAPDIKALMEVVRVSEANLGMAQDGMKQSLRNLEYAMDHMKHGKAIRYGDQGFEAPIPFQDRKALLQTAHARVTLFLERNLPSSETLRGYQARQDWETTTSQAASKHLGTPVRVSANRARDNDNQVVFRVSFEAMDPKHEDRSMKIIVDDTPKPAAKPKP